MTLGGSEKANIELPHSAFYVLDVVSFIWLWKQIKGCLKGTLGLLQFETELTFVLMFGFSHF